MLGQAPSNDLLQSLTTDASGRFESPGVQPGNYLVRTSAEDYLLAEQPAVTVPDVPHHVLPIIALQRGGTVAVTAAKPKFRCNGDDVAVLFVDKARAAVVASGSGSFGVRFEVSRVPPGDLWALALPGPIWNKSTWSKYEDCLVPVAVLAGETVELALEVQPFRK